jgi:hypothetical protein
MKMITSNRSCFGNEEEAKLTRERKRGNEAGGTVGERTKEMIYLRRMGWWAGATSDYCGQVTSTAQSKLIPMATLESNDIAGTEHR